MLKFKNRLKFFSALLVVTATILFVECNAYYPEKVNIMSGEDIQSNRGFAYTLETSSAIETYGNYDATVKLFGIIPVKEVTINVLPEMKIVPGGKAVGVKMFTKGLICVGSQSIQAETGENYNIAKALNIRDSDIILSANDIELYTVEQLGEIVSNSGGAPITLLIRSNEIEEEKVATPIKTKEGYKLGIWVRDSTAGIGTVTFVDKSTNTFAALGHPITDVDTGILMPVDKGTITSAEIVGVEKGSRGVPGELYGLFAENQDCGVILNNTNQGIYGSIVSDCNLTYKDEPLFLASAQQVKTGKAEIYANVEGTTIEKFDIEITKIMRYAPDEKNLVIRITDKRLLDKTGGIVQGMSGSPIIQDGKLIGAVTHVFVNDPSRGYGIFIENMLTEAKKIK